MSLTDLSERRRSDRERVLGGARTGIAWDEHLDVRLSVRSPKVLIDDPLAPVYTTKGMSQKVRPPQAALKVNARSVSSPETGVDTAAGANIDTDSTARRKPDPVQIPRVVNGVDSSNEADLWSGRGRDCRFRLREEPARPHLDDIVVRLQRVFRGFRLPESLGEIEQAEPGYGVPSLSCDGAG